LSGPGHRSIRPGRTVCTLALLVNPPGAGAPLRA
jgi:hypothetical protein